MTILCCDMCQKPLKGVRFQVTVLLRPERTMTVGPDCYRKEKKARQQMLERHTPEQIEALRLKIAATVNG